jgi:hypothetical protein
MRPLPGSAAWLLACGVGTAWASAPAPSETDLMQRARAWMAGIHKVDAGGVTVQPLDGRVQVRPCPSGWQFDQPFNNNDSVLRARCADPAWHLFLKVSLPARPIPTALPAAPSSPPSSVLAAPPAVLPSPAQAAAAAQAVAAPWMVRRGHTVMTTWATVPGLTVSARLEALDDGRLGDTIRLRNRDSGRVLSAQVSGQNQALGQ